MEIEGFLEYEYDYLEKHPYKEGYYDKILKFKNENMKKFKQSIFKADHILCVSENLKNTVISKYSINEKKITVTTQGCDSNKFFYDSTKREKYRRKLGIDSYFVLVFIGNISPSWQKISKTLEFYKIIKDLNKNTKLMLILFKHNKLIIRDFLDKYNIKITDIIIKYSLPNDVLPYYLNAADLALIIREDHQMNKVAAPAKFGEYACCGLPIIAGKGIANFSEKLAKTSYGIVLDNIYDNHEFTRKFKKFMEIYATLDRSKISRWGALNFSNEAYIDIYVNLLRKLSSE